MRKEQITDKEAIYTMIIFIIGSTLIIGLGSQATNDAWLAGIIGIILSIPVILMYSRIASLFFEKNLFEILNITMGKILGTIVSVLYIWYAFHLGALVIRNFGEFIDTSSLPETPILVPILFLGLVGIFIVKSGFEVIGRFSTLILPIIMIIILIVLVLTAPYLHFNYLKPILGNGLRPVINESFSIFSFPFAETVLFLGVFSSLKTNKSSYKVYASGVIFAGILIVIVTIRNISVLGPSLTSLYFPSYVAISRIHIGDFIERIEGTVSIVFIIGAFIKSSICLLFTCKGISYIFKLHDYNSVVIQIGLLMVYLSYIVYDSTMQMREWAFEIYRYYAFPFQVIIPLIVWILAEIKLRNKSSKIKLYKS